VRSRTDLDHALQLRLSKNTVTDIDEVISTVPQLFGFNRCRFIRAAVLYALASLAEDGYPKNGRGEETQENEQ
jgi:hypothetical protein